MYKFLFRSRFGAIGFVGLTLVSVMTLVGSDGESGLIQYGINSFTQQQDVIGEEIGELNTQQDRPVRRVGTPEPTIRTEVSDELDGDDEYEDDGYEEGDWGSDEFLIDDAAGFDPTPAGSTDFDAAEGEVVETVVGSGAGPMVQRDVE